MRPVTLGNKHCKLFNCATGLIFTDYLARLRVEKAKALLLDRNQKRREQSVNHCGVR
jgi:YesN/AraC family two-component response regulator